MPKWVKFSKKTDMKLVVRQSNDLMKGRGKKAILSPPRFINTVG